jgi:hypothetical protein
MNNSQTVTITPTAKKTRTPRRQVKRFILVGRTAAVNPEDPGNTGCSAAGDGAAVEHPGGNRRSRIGECAAFLGKIWQPGEVLNG